MNFHTLPQACRDIILNYWSVVKEIKLRNRPYYHYTDIGYALGMTEVTIHEYHHVMDRVKQIALTEINTSIQRHSIQEELEFYFSNI